MEELKKIRKDAFVNGIILGAVLLLLAIFSLYMLAYSTSFIGIVFSYLVAYLIVPLITAIILIKKLRLAIGGYWSFRQAVSGIFIMLITAYILSSIGSFVFIKYAQPDITVNAKNNFVSVFTQFMSKIGAETDKVDETVDEIEKQFDVMQQTSFSNIFSNMLTSIIVMFIVALIFAAIFKREDPAHHLVEQ